MRVIEGEDVNELYWRGMKILRAEGRREPSRNGSVLVLPEPVTSVYRNPRQRVLLDIKRKANPFFHLYESLWMLAGRNKVKDLERYITDFGTRFAEPSGEVHGAYGHRWRVAMGFDQIEAIVQRLRKNPTDRQCVLQMWDANTGDALINAGQMALSNDLLGDWKDRPCNTQVYFRLREEVAVDGLVGSFTSKSGMWPILDMMVTCRSNDIVFGAYGANAVHFSILQEYVAGRLGALVGTMYQLSWNFHGYEDVLEKVGDPDLCTYKGSRLKALPMMTEPDFWDEDLATFMKWHDRLIETGITEPGRYSNSWFKHTAEMVFLCHYRWKSALKNEARSMAQLIEAEDWRFVVLQWFDQRTEARSR